MLMLLMHAFVMVATRGPHRANQHSERPHERTDPQSLLKEEMDDYLWWNYNVFWVKGN